MNTSASSWSAVIGSGSTARPFMEGTIAGEITFSDSRGGRLRCPVVYWMLLPDGPGPLHILLLQPSARGAHLSRPAPGGLPLL